MLSKNKIKFLNSLSIKKYRELHGMFLAEGDKIVKELLISDTFQVYLEELFTTEEFFNSIKPELKSLKNLTITFVSEQELKKISTLTSPNKVILLLKIPHFEAAPLSVSKSLSLVFDDIQDPGNLGTIIRTASWFNISDIFCSSDSVDLYNPKVIQSTMAAFCHVKVHYANIAELLQYYHNHYGTEIVAASLEGQDLQEANLQTVNTMVVFGNESRGISPEIKKLITKEIKIPSFHYRKDSIDSLNIASACAIVCWEFMRSKNIYSK